MLTMKTNIQDRAVVKDIRCRTVSATIIAAGCVMSGTGEESSERAGNIHILHPFTETVPQGKPGVRTVRTGSSYEKRFIGSQVGSSHGWRSEMT